MPDPREFWNQRYSLPGWAYGTEPNDFIREWADRLSAPVLCLGEGEGRNAVYLASLGLDVTAVDLSGVALDKAKRLAAEKGVFLTTVEADLETYDLGRSAWGGIVAVWCHLPAPLRARVHRACVAALAPGGTLLLEAYTPRQLAHATGGPKTADMLYEPEALRADFGGLTLLHLQELERHVREGEWHQGTSAVVQVAAKKP